MRSLFWAVAALAAAGCTTPNMVAANGEAGAEQASATNVRERDYPRPASLNPTPRRPSGWGGNIYWTEHP